MRDRVMLAALKAVPAPLPDFRGITSDATTPWRVSSAIEFISIGSADFTAAGSR